MNIHENYPNHNGGTNIQQPLDKKFYVLTTLLGENICC